MKAQKNEALLHVEIKFNNVKQKVKPKKTNPVLQGDDVIEYLKDIQ